MLPGDTLALVTAGAPVTLSTGPENDEGGFLVGANQAVSFDHIESLAPIVSGGPAIINGTNGPDAITIIARSDLPGTDGVLDFTVSVNDGPEILFIDTPVLTVNALSGSDEIVLRSPGR